MPKPPGDDFQQHLYELGADLLKGKAWHLGPRVPRLVEGGCAVQKAIKLKQEMDALIDQARQRYLKGMGQI